MIHRFEPFHYDADQRLLFRGTEPVPLAPKTTDLLHVLLERRGRIVEKADLLKLVWPDAVVEEIGLARNVSLLRKALEDESGEPRYVETIPRRGYRFVAAPPETPVPVVDPPPPPVPRRRLWAIPLLLAAAGLVYWQFYRPSAFLPGGRASLAVIPFTCLCPGIDAEAFSEGFTDVFVAALAKPGVAQVVAPNTVRRYQRFGVSMALMARLLGLDALAEGSVQISGGLLRFTVRVVDVHTGRVIWAETLDRPTADPAASQVEIARLAAAEIHKKLSQ